MEDIVKNYMVSSEEYNELEKKFGDLAEFAAWQLFRKNSRNNHTDEQCDISQELKFAIIKAAAYFKRQTYIEQCLLLCNEYANTESSKKTIAYLQNIWDKKAIHGTKRQKFGPIQESLLDDLTNKIVPKDKIPSKKQRLKIDSKFSNYCKSITWNMQKAIGKKITKEKPIRTAMASLSEYDYLSITC